MNRKSKSVFLAYLLTTLPLVNAQSLPDAGSVREQTQQVPPSLPKAIELRLEGQPLLPVEQGGMRFKLQQVELEGNTVISSGELSAVFAEYIGREVDFGTLREIANKISLLYRQRGYAFAKGALPAQDIVGGKVKILILEGRFGHVTATVDGAPSPSLQKYLFDLKTGDVIESTKVERAALLMSELPGYNVVPVVRPSTTVGAGDLEVVARETPQYQGSVRVDNHGGELTGRHRGLLNMSRYRNFVVGDQLQLDALLSDGHTDLLNVSYALPLGVTGWRGNASLSRSSYELSGLEQYEDGVVKGGSDVFSLGISYPLVLNSKTTVTFSAAANTSRFKNDVAGIVETYGSTTLPLALRFSRRDDEFGGGVTFGSASLISGRFTGLERATARTFTKLSLDVARVQNLPDAFSAYVRLAGQLTGRGLDSSERMSVGGANGVRAFPSGEASGDRGLLAQFELRYQLPALGLMPYLFVDAARMTRIDATAGNITRSLSGHGLGLRWQSGRVSADLSAAWAGQTGLTSTESAGLEKPRYWFSVSYAF